MAERNSEPPTTREVHIGENFRPFSNKASIRTERNDEAERILGRNSIGYKTDAYLLLPFESENKRVQFFFWLYTCDFEGLGIVPFHPNKGYLVTNEDSDIESRKTKLLRYAKKERVINQAAPLILLIGIENQGLQKAGLADITNDKISLIGNSGILIRSLACVVSADGYYMSRGRPYLPKDAYDDYHFTDFFPLDSGSLSATDWGTSYSYDMLDGTESLIVGEGHPLYFADSEDEMSQIAARIIINPQFAYDSGQDFLGFEPKKFIS